MWWWRKNNKVIRRSEWMTWSTVDFSVKKERKERRMPFLRNMGRQEAKEWATRDLKKKNNRRSKVRKRRHSARKTPTSSCVIVELKAIHATHLDTHSYSEPALMKNGMGEATLHSQIDRRWDVRHWKGIVGEEGRHRFDSMRTRWRSSRTWRREDDTNEKDGWWWWWWWRTNDEALLIHTNFRHGTDLLLTSSVY